MRAGLSRVEFEPPSAQSGRAQGRNENKHGNIGTIGNLGRFRRKHALQNGLVDRVVR